MWVTIQPQRLKYSKSEAEFWDFNEKNMGFHLTYKNYYFC